MTINPYPSNIEALGAPYSNAFAVDIDALLTGDVALPYVSSALWIGARGRTELSVTTFGGQTVKLVTLSNAIIEIRAIKINQQPAIENPEWAGEDFRPICILALW